MGFEPTTSWSTVQRVFTELSPLSKNYNDFVEYQIARNKVVKAVRKAKLKFEKKLAKQDKNDRKSFFAYIRSKSKTKNKVVPLNDNKGNVATDNDEM